MASNEPEANTVEQSDSKHVGFNDLVTHPWLDRVVRQWLSDMDKAGMDFDDINRGRAAFDTKWEHGDRLPADLACLRALVMQMAWEPIRDDEDPNNFEVAETGRIARLAEAAYILGYNNCRDGRDDSVPTLDLDG